MTKTSLTLSSIALVLSSCTTTDVVMLEGSAKYAPTKDVQILMQPPSRPYKQIAMLESRGEAGAPTPKLLENMRKKAAAIGADAVIPTEDASTKQQQQLIFNPLLGGLQTIGGNRLPVLRGVAIKYTD